MDAIAIFYLLAPAVNLRKLYLHNSRYGCHGM